MDTTDPVDALHRRLNPFQRSGLTLGMKLAIGQFAIIVLCLLAMLVSIGSVRLLTISVTSLYDSTHDELRSIEELADTLAENRIAEAYLIHSSGQRGGDLLVKRHQTMVEQFGLLDGLLAEDPLRPKLEQLKADWARYMQSQRRLVGLAQAGRTAEAEQLFAGDLERQFDRADHATDALVDLIDARAEQREAGAEFLAFWAMVGVSLLGLATFAVSLTMRIIGRNRIGRPIAEITQSLSRLAGGDLSVSVAGAERDDEIGAMVRALEIFRANAMELEQAHLDTKEAQARAEALARHDPLTGLPNRRLLVEAIERLERTSHGPTALLMIDLDRFKPVNDIHGHQAGDHVLCVLAERLEALIEGATLGRLGGDEFAMIVPLVHGADDAVKACRLVSQAVQSPFAIAETQIEIGATIGISLYPQDGRDASALLRAADLAMYDAKARGRGSYRFFEASMQAEVDRRVTFDRELQNAIAQHQIKPHYQPLVAMGGTEVVGFEVLARWEHPVRGMIMPDQFIPAAEERGLLPEMTAQLLHQTCVDAQQWPDHIHFSVNMSPSQLRDPLLPARVLAVLQKTGMRPQRIEIEVTENALVSDLEATKDVLTSLQNLGITIALDDFGTGYSSLYHLRELRFDKIKVDRSFVQALELGDEKDKIVRAMIGLGKSLGLTTTAEGIESPEQWERLKLWGCDFGQGFLFGCAMPATQVAHYLATRNEVAFPEPARQRA